MYSALINAVLSSSPDYDLLFESLSWPSQSWPDTERVEALTAFIEGLGPLLTEPDLTSFPDAKRRCVLDKVESVLWTKCLPFLSRISAEAGEGVRCRESTAAACRLLSVSVPLCNEAVCRRVCQSILPSLHLSEEELTSPGRLSVEVASEVVAALLPFLAADEQLTHTTVSSSLSSIRTLPDALVSKPVRVILSLLNCLSSERLISILKLILDDLCSWHSTDRTPAVTERTLLCLTALSDHLLKPHHHLPSSCCSDPDPRLSLQFWRMVQDGLIHRDSVSRKRALFLLKRCAALSEEDGLDCPLSATREDENLFKWAFSKSKLLREFWEDYVLVMETLEENQIHVVRPVLNRIDTLIQTTANDDQGQGLFHPSWLLCVYQRMFHSENKSLMREGVCHLLELRVLQQPTFALAFSQFIVGPFMDVLSETSLFHRSVGQSVGDCPELGVKLEVFLATFFSSLPTEHRGCVLLQLIQQLGSKHWCAVPLLFLCQALSKLPPSPLLGTSGLTALRDVLRCTMITHQVLLRGAAQCFLLNSALSLTVVSEVTLDDVFSFLTHFRADESLCRGTQLWKQLCAWLLENEGSFKPRITDEDCTGASTSKETVRAYVQGEIVSYLRVPASTGQTERLPDSREADKLARAILLCVDMERGQSGAEISNTLESLLSPLLETLSRVSTNIYLPLRKSDKSLQLVLRLFQLGEIPRSQRNGAEQGLTLVRDEEALCVEAVSLSWELVQGLSTNANDFWPALKGFISTAFHHKLLQLTQAQSPTLAATLKQIARDLMELSQSKSGVFGVLLQHCCQMWLPAGGGSGDQANTVFSSIFNHISIITEACVYGPVFRRDQRLVQDVQIYVEQLGEKCAANVAVASDNRDDQLPRTCVLAFLCHLDSSNLQHQRLMEEVAMELLKKDNDISRSKVRYYSNSLQHRAKNRVWQTLLLLLPKLREEFVATLWGRVFEAGFCSNQASVKYLIEWMMILILVRYPQHTDSFWSCFSLDHEKTKTSVCTFLSVLVHFSVIFPNLEEKAAQLRKALDVILQSCFNHNFSVRLYALLALKRVWSLAENHVEEADGLGGLSSVIKACLNQAEAMQSTGNANKNWTRIQEHFFFGAFHPIRDYSIETIFCTFPSLSELADDEWIPPWKFEKLSYFSEGPSLPLRNPAPDLNQLQPGDWIQQDRSEQDKEERWAEVQKKITPWRLGIQEQEPELQLVPPQRAARLGKLHGALLVVASLIDKPTNLGGLCRTCEIFGASALVLDSLRHVNDKNFQSLSVSAELWLPLLEVKPMELTEFLQVKKSEGYCIVGVEQTANSHSLQEYQFPEKTLLLLGNEREGIPANLLQMLDVCVEIPQQGIIRSLNVHVSAALLIWEYTRQHLSSGSAEVDSKRC
ncbi:probable methyltransferase TARBP1 [Neolamprologus brichardi]|uniref:probable methyltransferase TARBP1 n=1 Tax=Neolamprologus brichardi TaxID=32507 RepID=UPI001643F302|nr:probable methyltransferase TARBP1 [Neolamprologus brichardi]